MFMAVLQAQEYNVGLSFLQNHSSLRFVDSHGNKQKEDSRIGYGYSLFLQKTIEDYYLEGSLSYNNRGAMSSYGTSRLEWSLHYLGASVSAARRFSLFNLNPHAGIGLYYGRLFKAGQITGQEYFNLLAEDEIKKNDLGFNIFAGLNYAYSDGSSLFFRLDRYTGIAQIEKRQPGQKLFNRSFSVQLGLIFRINELSNIQ